MSITNFTEKLEINKKVSGIERYENLELVHRFCNRLKTKIISDTNALTGKEVGEYYKEIQKLRLAEII